MRQARASPLPVSARFFWRRRDCSIREKRRRRGGSLHCSGNATRMSRSTRPHARDVGSGCHGGRSDGPSRSCALVHPPGEPGTRSGRVALSACRPALLASALHHPQPSGAGRPAHSAFRALGARASERRLLAAGSRRRAGDERAHVATPLRSGAWQIAAVLLPGPARRTRAGPCSTAAASTSTPSPPRSAMSTAPRCERSCANAWAEACASFAPICADGNHGQRYFYLFDVISNHDDRQVPSKVRCGRAVSACSN
jgi:hypothetical protein